MADLSTKIDKIVSVLFPPKDPAKNFKDYPTLQEILTEVCDFYAVEPTEVKSNRRRLAVILPRQVAAFLMRDLTLHSLPTIANILGGRDHSTIHHAVGK